MKNKKTLLALLVGFVLGFGFYVVGQAMTITSSGGGDSSPIDRKVNGETLTAFQFNRILDLLNPFSVSGSKVGIGTDNDAQFTITGGGDIGSANHTGRGQLLLQDSTGNTTGSKVRLDPNEMQASHNGAASSYRINPFGGNAYIGSNDVGGRLQIEGNNTETKLILKSNSNDYYTSFLKRDASDARPHAFDLYNRNNGSWIHGLTVMNNGQVGMSGETSPDKTLSLDVAGSVGANSFCDENGNNCVDGSEVASKTYVDSKTNSGSGVSCGWHDFDEYYRNTLTSPDSLASANTLSNGELVYKCAHTSDLNANGATGICRFQNSSDGWVTGYIGTGSDTCVSESCYIGCEEDSYANTCKIPEGQGGSDDWGSRVSRKGYKAQYYSCH